MDEKELAKKLAEWRGFRKVKHFDGEDLVEKWCLNGLYYLVPPDFTHSLEACFKELVPALNVHYIKFTSGGNCELRTWDGPVYTNSPIKSSIKPSLALCLAIEKLVDWQRKEVKGERTG